MNAYKLGDNVGLVFTTVLNQLNLGMVGEDEEVQEVTDRHYWEKRGSKRTLAIVDELLTLVHKNDTTLELKYNKFYIGLARKGEPDNFVVFRPKKDWLRLEPRLPRAQETQDRLEAEGLDVMDYDERWGRYRIRLAPGDIQKHAEFVSGLMSEAFTLKNK